MNERSVDPAPRTGNAAHRSDPYRCARGFHPDFSYLATPVASILTSVSFTSICWGGGRADAARRECPHVPVHRCRGIDTTLGAGPGGHVQRLGLVREAISTHDGHCFKALGDAFCAAFGTPHVALAAALQAQRALAVQNWRAFGPKLEPLRARMAIHHGSAEAREFELRAVRPSYPDLQGREGAVGRAAAGRSRRPVNACPLGPRCRSPPP